MSPAACRRSASLSGAPASGATGVARVAGGGTKTARSAWSSDPIHRSDHVVIQHSYLVVEESRGVIALETGLETHRQRGCCTPMLHKGDKAKGITPVRAHKFAPPMEV